ncbi:hypothetical protein MW887_009879 [Aspergillus wentii]|nr:hypothetical protein MW887_009879 [Aspergillus wentii]
MNGTLPVQCGNLTVPLDYTSNKSDETLNLQLLKVPSLHTPKKGSILFNFGGPGVAARPSLASKAKVLQILTGGYYDLIAHDPRGTANTLTFSCFEDAESRLANLTYYRFNEYAARSEKMPLGRQWSAASLFAESCHKYKDSKDKGELISTAFAARDLMQIVDAVEDDGLLRYWGLSYGTVLGSTVAAMFPDRIDRIIIDGVMNPHQYYHSYDVEMWSDTDMVFSNFLKQCLKSPDRCALAHHNATAAGLEKSLYSLFDDMKYNPIAFDSMLIDHSVVKGTIRSALNNPSLWPTLSLALESLLAGNVTGFLATQASLAPKYGSDGLAEPLFGIPCSEKRTGKHTLKEVMPALTALDDKSKLLGQAGAAVAMTCSQWKFDAKERYTGDFNVKTKHPMLVIGNTYDPATPIQSARNITASFEGSVLLEHGGYGHCSQQHGSVCTGKAIQAYFTNGTLPRPGTVCETSYPPFANKTWNDVLPAILT